MLGAPLGMVPICPDPLDIDDEGIGMVPDAGCEADMLGRGMGIVELGLGVGFMPPVPATTTTIRVVTLTPPHHALMVAVPGLACWDIFAQPDQFIGLVDVMVAEPPEPVMAV